MAPSKTLIAASLLLAWMGAVASIMILARTINIGIFFVLRLIGFLTITGFIVVTTLRPKSTGIIIGDNLGSDIGDNLGSDNSC